MPSTESFLFHFQANENTLRIDQQDTSNLQEFFHFTLFSKEQTDANIERDSIQFISLGLKSCFKLSLPMAARF